MRLIRTVAACYGAYLAGCFIGGFVTAAAQDLNRRLVADATQVERERKVREALAALFDPPPRQGYGISQWQPPLDHPQTLFRGGDRPAAATPDGFAWPGPDDHGARRG